VVFEENETRRTDEVHDVTVYLKTEVCNNGNLGDHP